MAPTGDEEAEVMSPICMRVLHAVCDTLIPSLLPPPPLPQPPHASHDQVAAFFKLGASDLPGLPKEVARKMARFLRPDDMTLVSRLLWLMSTCAGTLLLADKLSFADSNALLSVKAFPDLPFSNRESLLSAWSSSPLLKIFFKVLKGFILREFYTQVDENGINSVVWNALNYPGPDPQIGPVVMDACDFCLDSKLVEIKNHPEVACLKLGVLDSGNGKHGTEVRIKTDVVIIGSGSGGGVVAAQLAEAGYEVVVLEKGQYFSRNELRLLEGPSADMYEGAGFLSSVDGGVSIFAGSTLGGGSAINWGACFKTPLHVLQEWSQKHGLELFSSQRYADAMESVCQRLQVQEETERENFANSMFRKGCHVLGMHVGNVPRNAPPDHYCGWCGMGCKSGKKQSVNRAWLVDAAMKGATILTACEARKITLRKQWQGGKGMRATGVVARASTMEGTKSTVVVEAKVVVAACGALWTPLLLSRSGLRNANIGRNLHVHPVMNTWGYFKDVEPSLGKSYEGGIMTAFSREAANWDTSGYGALLMVPSMHPGAFASMMPWVSGRRSKEMMLGFANTVHLIAITRDSGSGHVCEDRNGSLHVKYKLSKGDRSHCLDAACNGLRVLAAAGATRVGTHSVEGDVFESSTASTERLEVFISKVRSKCLRKLNTPLNSAHQMGSCRMGTSPSTSAVDQNCETWEAQGLFVADSSVFPTASGVNPMITVQSIAMCTSQSILNFLKSLEKA